MKNELIGKSAKPDLQLLNFDGSAVKGNNTKIAFIRVEKDEIGNIKYRMSFPVVYKNKGNGTPKRVFSKMWIRGIDTYVNKFVPSVDEFDKNYTSQTSIIHGREDIVSNTPPGQSTFQSFIIEPLDKILAIGEYDAIIRVSYGEELENKVEANFKILYDGKANTIDLTKPTIPAKK